MKSLFIGCDLIRTFFQVALAHPFSLATLLIFRLLTAHLVDRVNSFHDPVLQKLEIAQLHRIVHAVVFQVFVPKTFLWVASWWKKVGFQKSPWKSLCRPLCVGPCQRSYTPRLPRWMLPTWEIVTLIGVGTQKKKRKLDCNLFVVSNEPRRGKMTTSWQHYISLHSPYHNDISWRNSMKWISSGSPSVQLTLKGFWRGRRGAWGEKITCGASSWRGKKLLMACAACKKSDVVGLPPHLLAKAQYRKNS